MTDPGIGSDPKRPKTSLWKAVHAVQGEATTLQKDKLNPHFKSKYLGLDTLMEQVLPLLNKHGLVWLTAPNYILVNAGPESKSVEPNLSYRLIHAESGDETSGTLPLLLSKRDAQGLGSAITYARRYALMAVLGLVADEDDDGHQASRPARTTRSTQQPSNDGKPLTPDQLNNLLKRCEAAGKDIELLVGAIGLDSTDDITVGAAKQIVALLGEK